MMKDSLPRTSASDSSQKSLWLRMVRSIRRSLAYLLKLEEKKADKQRKYSDVKLNSSVYPIQVKSARETSQKVNISHQPSKEETHTTIKSPNTDKSTTPPTPTIFSPLISPGDPLYTQPKKKRRSNRKF